MCHTKHDLRLIAGIKIATFRSDPASKRVERIEERPMKILRAVLPLLVLTALSYAQQDQQAAPPAG
jgi:hypothetical protein